ncbi:hypothetical protein F53441_9250 [Fusarium austroafricanum]|uniref:Kelch repeat protein n=1 Tax=Fusarium austroafricanum TaxID=2364996 RepID=A0A8H4KCU5_9HYPO|nr:hypothetical protein F53441_9250 [Fusarium austroafricanum]
MPQIHANLSKNDSILSVHGGALWADDINYRLYLFGGQFFGGSPITSSLMSYDIWYDQWDDFGPPAEGISRVSYGASTTVKERGEGYYYGGYLSRASDSDWSGKRRATADLIRYKMDDNAWSKLAGPDNIKRAEGVMTFIPASDRGMLVYFGGVQDPENNGTLVAQPMDQIFIYDIISNKWHIQEASGSVPDSRGKFCAGAVWTEDRSSYNIYLNAGIGLEGSGFDDVYVLSLPSFTWIKTYPLDRNGTGDYPSHSLSCDIVNKGSQMLTIGGTFPNDDSTCDVDEVWGVHNIDLGNRIKSNFKKVWAGYEPTLFGYKVPSFVSSVIGGNKDGKATKKEPEAGFVNHDLGTLLGMKAAFTPRKRLKDGRTDPAKATPSEATSSKSGLSTGAIVGISVGAGVGLLGVLAGLYLLRRRRQKTSPEVQSAATAKPIFSVPYMPPAIGTHYYTQSTDGGQDLSIRYHDNGWEGPDQIRQPRVSVEPSEMDGRGIGALDTGMQTQHNRRPSRLHSMSSQHD